MPVFKFPEKFGICTEMTSVVAPPLMFDLVDQLRKIPVKTRNILLGEQLKSRFHDHLICAICGASSLFTLTYSPCHSNNSTCSVCRSSNACILCGLVLIVEAFLTSRSDKRGSCYAHESDYCDIMIASPRAAKFSSQIVSLQESFTYATDPELGSLVSKYNVMIKFSTSIRTSKKNAELGTSFLKESLKPALLICMNFIAVASSEFDWVTDWNRENCHKLGENGKCKICNRCCLCSAMRCNHQPLTLAVNQKIDEIEDDHKTCIGVLLFANIWKEAKKLHSSMGIKELTQLCLTALFYDTYGPLTMRNNPHKYHRLMNYRKFRTGATQPNLNASLLNLAPCDDAYGFYKQIEIDTQTASFFNPTLLTRLFEVELREVGSSVFLDEFRMWNISEMDNHTHLSFCESCGEL